jgi:hypothetical protein
MLSLCRQKESLVPILIKAAQNDAGATDTAIAQVTRDTEALTPIVESAPVKVRELSDGFAAEFKKIAGLTVDAYRQASYYLGDPTAWV